MIKGILNCRKCDLYKNQLPCLDVCTKSEIMLVGLSAKIKKNEDEIPLDERTRSGKFAGQMGRIAEKYGYRIYRTNIVKCPPVGANGKLRYPGQEEIDCCLGNLFEEIETVKPRIVFMFGKIVTDAVSKKLQTKQTLEADTGFKYYKYDRSIFVESYHPSYLLRSRQRTETYLRNYEQFLRNCM